MEKSNNSMIKGASIITAGILLTKIFGFLVAVPIQRMLGSTGGALYGYAYNIYIMFFSLSTVGIPMGISKLVAMYRAKGYYSSIEKLYKILKRIMLLLGIISFTLMFIFAPFFAEWTLNNNDASVGNTVSDVAFVIRAVSFAVLIVPIMSLTRGYLQGFNKMNPTAVSQVVEQLGRIIFLVVITYLVIYVFDMNIKYGAASAAFAAFIGALFGYIVLRIFYNPEKITKNEILANSDETNKTLSSTTMLKTLVKFSIPFVTLAVLNNLYLWIDQFTVVKTLQNVGFSLSQSETVYSVVSLYGFKISAIIVAFSSGLLTSLIPSISTSYTEGDMKEVFHKIKQSIMVVIFISLPLAVFISVMSEPVWNILYTPDKLSSQVFSGYVFISILNGLKNISVGCTQSINKNRGVLISMVAGLVVKFVLNVPLMYLFRSLGWFPPYGFIIATLLGYSVTILLNMFVLRESLKVKFSSMYKNIIKVILLVIVDVLILKGLQYIIPLGFSGAISSFLYTAFYGIVLTSFHLFVATKMGLVKSMLGPKITNQILRKLKLK